MAEPATPPPASDPLAGPSPFSPPEPSRPQRWDIALVIAAGGALGGASRHAVNHWMPVGSGGFPWHTFVENILGCFLLAVVSVVLLEVLPPHRYARPFLGIGLLGGFTTFSAYTSDARVLLQAGQGDLAIVYVAGSVAAGLVAVVVGLSVTRAATGVTPLGRRRQSR